MYGNSLPSSEILGGRARAKTAYRDNFGRYLANYGFMRFDGLLFQRLYIASKGWSEIKWKSVSIEDLQYSSLYR